MTTLARIAQLHRELAEAYDALADERADRFIDQNASPLGRRRHCQLVRSGVLTGYRDGRKLLVRESDLAAYLAARRVAVTERAPDEAEELLASAGLRVA